MKKSFLTLTLALALAGTLALTACGNEVRQREDGSLYTSYLPPETATIGEEFAVDTQNKITITNLELRTQDDGSRVLIVRYDWTNDGTTEATVGESILLSVTQEGVSPEPDLSLVTSRDKLVTPVAPGETLTDIEQGYLVESEEPLTLSFTGEEETIFIEGKPASAYPVRIEVEFPG